MVTEGPASRNLQTIWRSTAEKIFFSHKRSIQEEGKFQCQGYIERLCRRHTEIDLSELFPGL